MPIPALLYQFEDYTGDELRLSIIWDISYNDSLFGALNVEYTHGDTVYLGLDSTNKVLNLYEALGSQSIGTLESFQDNIMYQYHASQPVNKYLVFKSIETIGSTWGISSSVGFSPVVLGYLVTGVSDAIGLIAIKSFDSSDYTIPLELTVGGTADVSCDYKIKFITPDTGVFERSVGGVIINSRVFDTSAFYDTDITPLQILNIQRTEFSIS